MAQPEITHGFVRAFLSPGIKDLDTGIVTPARVHLDRHGRLLVLVIATRPAGAPATYTYSGATLNEADIPANYRQELHELYGQDAAVIHDLGM